MRLEDLFTLLLSLVAFAPLCGVLFGIVASVFWIMTLIDCMKSDLPDKTAWVLVIIFLGPLGALAVNIANRDDDASSSSGRSAH